MGFSDLGGTMRAFANLVAILQLIGASVTFPRMRGRHVGVGSLFVVAFMAVLFGSQPTPLFVPAVVPGALGLVAAVAIFLWARVAIRGRSFSAINSTDVPQFVCSTGPYHWIRHPFYTSYLSTLLSMTILYPNPITIGGSILAVVSFNSAAAFEEAKFEESPVAAEYAAYKRRTGRFLPKFLSKLLSS